MLVDSLNGYLNVDDDAATRELLASVLERAGATVETAESPVRALESIGRQPPDLVIADIGMPEQDGYSLIRRIRRAAGKVLLNGPPAAGIKI